MEHDENSRPASQLIAGFASPSTPLGASGGSAERASSITSLLPADFNTRSNVEKDELRVQVSTLRYELENIKQERDLQTLRYEKESRDLQLKWDADFRKAQAAESASNRATLKAEASAKELNEVQEQALIEKASLERKIRALQDEKQALQEECDESRAQASDQERQFKYQINELETVRASLQKTIEELQNDLQDARNAQQATQERLAEREAEVAELEAENIRLKSEGNDAESMAVFKRQLSEQVNHIRDLETTNREQASELRHLRKVQKNVEVVEEQKRSLENQLQLMSGLEAELNTLQFQKQALEDERQSWTMLLQGDDGSAEFDNPEAVVKALMEERIEKAAMVDKLGLVDAQFLEKDEAIKNLEDETTKLNKEVESLRAAGGAPADTRARQRLERLRALAVKEVEYLRAQLKTFDEEELTMNGDENQFDAKKSEQIAQLQQLVDEYRGELQKAHEELSKQEAPPQQEQPTRGTKRPFSSADSENESERIAGLSRKLRKMQDALGKSEQARTLVKKELEAAKAQVKSLQSKSRTRVLELRDNPTAEVEKIKMSTLRTLKAENRDLLAQLQGDHANVKVVPVSTLESLKLELQEMERLVADKEKTNRRLKEVYALKAIEFREAVASLLGYKLDILPSGRVRVTSMFHLSAAYRHGDPSASSDSRGPGSMGNGEKTQSSLMARTDQ
ncbi:Mitotic checkpoint [Penicillium chermesinum]|nr:Mitotic checkpoint [Penicillium chermesinum]